ncbi:SDR family NAD(P)-dependent oxidoreductase [Tsukamurella sp. 8F]|uniref:SDR family NAD(P)-dependent oxidoreductase n=1 Tax=unclassified Tsukamurella TaxID=2633480 RepID=UPI0023B924F5|nr:MULTISPECIES: SDR family NAD(P)-dependent oxidoreductase [unclassified Tsukamurella]MDF0530561.1 SDR family NAD(P)-dependent oxidoreductase [Tsukamurella sp. 8J]MDF0586789.1 SDR family NAD(P)-dependent oxidoreductase [Tsukamurella sp. 8F]
MPEQPTPEGVILVLGGRSEIGVEVARRICVQRTVVLAARRSNDLTAQREALLADGASAVEAVEFDADDTASHGPMLRSIAERHGRIGVAVVAFGILGDQARAEADAAHAVQIAHTDYVAQVSVLTELAVMLKGQALERGSRGAIIAFSSIAGVRVRRANYVYGSAKAGLDGFVQGFADALGGTGVQVLLARPGFVIGQMTKELMESGVKPAPMSSTPQQVADATVAALGRRRRVVWIPGTLRGAAAVMRVLPHPLWRRMPR